MPEQDGAHMGPYGGEPISEWAAYIETCGSITLGAAGRSHGENGWHLVWDGSGTELFAHAIGFGDQSELYIRLYCELDPEVAGLDADSVITVIVVWDTTITYLAYIGISMDAEGNPNGIFATDQDGNYCYGAAVPNDGSRHYIELHWKKDPSAGGVEGWYDGEEFVLQAMDNDTSGQTDIGDYIMFGTANAGLTNNPENGEWLDLDDLRVNTTVRVGEYAVPHCRRRVS